MKQIYILSLLTAFFTLHLSAQTTFNWETGSSDGVTVQQTVNTVTVTFTPATTAAQFLNANGFSDSEGFVAGSNANEESVSITFSRAINVESIFAFNGDQTSPPRNWIFTPNSGSNSPVIESIPMGLGIIVNLNWTDVTEIVITSEEGLDFFAVDDIVSDFSLSTNSIEDSNRKVKLFPNPASDFIYLSNLTETESYTIYNVLGSKVLKGTISNKEGIDIRNLTNGLYLLNFDNGETLKFVKE